MSRRGNEQKRRKGEASGEKKTREFFQPLLDSISADFLSTHKKRSSQIFVRLLKVYIAQIHTDEGAEMCTRIFGLRTSVCFPSAEDGENPSHTQHHSSWSWSEHTASYPLNYGCYGFLVFTTSSFNHPAFSWWHVKGSKVQFSLV